MKLQPVVTLRYGGIPNEELVKRLRQLMLDGRPFHVDTHEVPSLFYISTEHDPLCPRVVDPEVTCVCGALAQL